MHQGQDREGEGKAGLDPGVRGWGLVRPFQFIDFKTDRFGAAVGSGAILGTDNDHTPEPDRDRYHFDGPFLIVLKKRTAKNPSFVMWVENTELLGKR